MMNYMTKTQMIRAYNKGLLDDVAKQLRRYATITSDKSFEIESGYHKGHHRVTNFAQHNLNWEVHFHNGEVKQLGYTL